MLSGLSRPTSVVIGPDGAIYVTNNGTAMATRDDNGTLLTGGEVLAGMRGHVEVYTMNAERL